MRSIGLSLLASAALLACGGSGSPTDADGDAGSDACPKTWTALVGADTNARVQDGALIISGTNLAGNDLQLRRDGLEGDFEVSFTVESLSTNDIGPYVTFGAIDFETRRGLGAGLRTFPERGVHAYPLPSAPDSPVQSVDNDIEPVHVAFERTGTRLIATAGNNFDGAGMQMPDFPATGPVRLMVYLGGYGDGSGGTTVRISDFTVISGNGVTSDTFDCDSLIIQ